MSLKHNLTASLVGGASSATEGTASVKDDLYLSVNGEWLKTAKIPADLPTIGGFTDLEVGIETTLITDFEEMLAGKVEPNNVLLANFIEYYRLLNDVKSRDKAGFSPIKSLIDEVQSVSDFKELQDKLLPFLKQNVGSLFPLSVDPDMKDAKHHVLTVGAPRLILPDTTYYEASNEQGSQLLQLYRGMMTKLFTEAGFAESKTQQILDQAFSFDAKLAQHKKSSEEMSDVVKQYNPETLTEFGRHSSVLDLKAYVDLALSGRVTRVIVDDPKYYNGLNDIITIDSLGEIKSWLLVQILHKWSGYLSEDIRTIGSEYGCALMGMEEATPLERYAFETAKNQFDMVVGDYYARKYFGTKAKHDVMHMVQRMVDIYKERLSHSDWLSEETRQKAILKLKTLVPNVGFPDKIDPVYSKYVVTPASEGGTLVGNRLRFREIELQNNFDQINQPVDRTMWADIDPATVNAYYEPTANIIVFPAAILQAPFYSLKQTESENFGGIGAVMAHEISHAFDNNGSQFDEHGNMKNWWTRVDLEHFKKLTDSMVEEFDGIEFVGQKVNGRLTVTENVADGGGLNCALEAAKTDTDFSAKDFFENWAKIWREKSSTEFLHWVMATDVHAPSKLRANVQAQNIDDFYTTFDVHEGDGMWLAPEKRVHIW